MAQVLLALGAGPSLTAVYAKGEAYGGGTPGPVSTLTPVRKACMT